MTTDRPPPFIGSKVILAFGWKSAVDALEAALTSGFDPEQDPERTYVSLGGDRGIWFMPSQLGAWTGAKFLTVFPSNSERNLPTIQGVYVLSDGVTGTPTAVLDGAALTTLRTASTSALAVRHLQTRPLERLVVFGAGVQAEAHVDALAATTGLGTVQIVARSPHRVDQLVARLTSRGVDARAAAPDAVVGADAIVCATRSSTPVFDGDLVSSHALVVAIGTHTPDTRELDSLIVGRSQVFVESMGRALSENGNVLQAMDAGATRASDLTSIAQLVRGDVRRDTDRPGLFTGTGMGWQDLAVASAVQGEKRRDEPGPDDN